MIQIKFPDDFWVGDDAVYIPKCDQMQRGRFLSVLWNQVVEIRGAFLRPVSKDAVLKFAVTSVTNPISTRESQSIQVKLFYEEYTAEITSYLGNNMRVKATPSLNEMEMQVQLSTQLTGQIPSMTISVQVPRQVERQAYLLVDLPGEYIIQELGRVASSCTAL